MRRSPILAEECGFNEDTCPQMQTFIEQVAKKHGVDLATVGVRLWLALPDTSERLFIAGLSGSRVGLTHCVADSAQLLSCDMDLVFSVTETGWQPIELLHTEAVWVAYTQRITATQVAPVQDGEGNLNLALFAESWAEQLMKQRWLEDSQPLCI